MTEDDALDRAKRALAVIPRGGAAVPAHTVNADEILKRAYAATRNTPAVISPSEIDKLLDKAREASRPVAPRPTATAAPIRPAVREPEVLRQAPRNPPPAVIEDEPRRRAVAGPEPHRVERLPAELPAQNTAAANVSQTIIVQVAAPAPVYPYPYPYPYPYWAGCLRMNCPMRVGHVCRRWFCI
jgi:hypothetical protein